jgi:hypothetical protein
MNKEEYENLIDEWISEEYSEPDPRNVGSI